MRFCPLIFVSSKCFKLYCFLSYDVAIIQRITSCHKNHMTTRAITLWHERVTLLTTSVSTMRFRFEIMYNLKAIKSHFKGSFDKQNLTLVVITYEIYETRQRRVSLLSYEMTTSVRSSIYTFSVVIH